MLKQLTAVCTALKKHNTRGIRKLNPALVPIDTVLVDQTTERNPQMAAAFKSEHNLSFQREWQ